MDTIKLSAGGHDISFSKKSLTIDDKVYLYTGISAIKHSSAKKLYLFKYEDQWHKLPYDEQNQNKIATIFKRVAEMNAKRHAKAETAVAETAAEKPEEKLPSLAEVMEENAGLVEAAVEADAALAEETPAEEAPAEEQPADTQEEAVEEEAEAAEETEEVQDAEETQDAEAKPEELQRKKRLKKAFGILAIIIALFILAGVAYFFIFGTSKDASQSPNTDSTHEYNDIDELIDEMNE